MKLCSKIIASLPGFKNYTWRSVQANYITCTAALWASCYLLLMIHRPQPRREVLKLDKMVFVNNVWWFSRTQNLVDWLRRVLSSFVISGSSGHLMAKEYKYQQSSQVSTTQPARARDRSWKRYSLSCNTPCSLRIQVPIYLFSDETIFKLVGFLPPRIAHTLPFG